MVASYQDDWRNENAKELSQEYKNKIIEISVKYNIASKYTSFISVNEREEKVFEPTAFENVTLSDMEVPGTMFMDAPVCDLAPFIKSRKASRKTGVSFDTSIGSRDMDYMIRDEVMEPVLDNNIIEQNISDWKTFDVFTFLLTIIYLSKKNSKMPIQNMIKEYFENYSGDIG